MATRHEVTCIIPDGPDHDRRIDSIGGTDGGGWTMLEDDAIKGLRNGAFTLWTRGGGKIAEVVPIERPNGRWHLQTLADGVLSNNLLYLPRCPGTYRRVS
jgi:hypothetical protein